MEEKKKYAFHNIIRVPSVQIGVTFNAKPSYIHKDAPWFNLVNGQDREYRSVGEGIPQIELSEELTSRLVIRDIREREEIKGQL